MRILQSEISSQIALMVCLVVASLVGATAAQAGHPYSMYYAQPFIPANAGNQPVVANYGGTAQYQSYGVAPLQNGTVAGGSVIPFNWSRRGTMPGLYTRPLYYPAPSHAMQNPTQPIPTPYGAGSPQIQMGTPVQAPTVQMGAPVQAGTPVQAGYHSSYPVGAGVAYPPQPATYP